jgi:peroxiredoxin
MRALLAQAQSLAPEPALQARIRDDLRRIDRLGKPLDISLTFTDGRKRSLSDFRGQVVVLVFWSSESPHALIWIQKFRERLAKLGVPNVVVLGVNLDTDRAAMDEAMKQLQIHWPTQFEGKGWESPLARELGINALPTVWLIDRRGNLRSLNARDNYETTLRLLQREQ